MLSKSLSQNSKELAEWSELWFLSPMELEVLVLISDFPLFQEPKVESISAIT